MNTVKLNVAPQEVLIGDVVELAGVRYRVSATDYEANAARWVIDIAPTLPENPEFIVDRWFTVTSFDLLEVERPLEGEVELVERVADLIADQVKPTAVRHTLLSVADEIVSAVRDFK